MEIPAFMLKKLYKKGSLTNTSDGLSFVVKNSISPATVIGVGLLIDQQPCDPQGVTLITSTSTVNADQITEEAALHVNWNDAITLVVKDMTLEPGSHDLSITIITRDVGPLTLDVSDTLAE